VLPTEGVKTPLATVQNQIKQVENSMPAVVIRVIAVCVDNVIVLYYRIFKMAHEEPEIETTDPNILIDNKGSHDELYFGMPGGRIECGDEGDEGDQPDAIPTSSWGQRPATAITRFNL
jgi:hypothetical protein